MRVQIVSIEDISDEMVSQWNAWAAPDGQLVSPYLHFGFTATVARTRSDVRIALFEDDDGLAGFFPHHMARDGVIRPIGAPMSDYQGIIAAPGKVIDPSPLLRSAQASALVFDNWHGSHGGDHQRGRDGSAIADLTEGSEAYFEARSGMNRQHFRKLARLQRNAEREFGPARVEIGDPDGAAFKQLRAWKQAQYEATGKLNVFGVGWVQRALEGFRSQEGQDFGGLTASLWFGDRLAAVEFGLSAGGVYHSWFPAYDPELAKYSPGLLLLHGIIDQAHDHGIERIDLGGGGAHYKKYYTSYEVPLAEGRILSPGLAALGIYGWEIAESAARIMPDRLAQIPARLRRRWAQASAFESRLAPRLASMATALSL